MPTGVAAIALRPEREHEYFIPVPFHGPEAPAPTPSSFSTPLRTGSWRNDCQAWLRLKQRSWCWASTILFPSRTPRAATTRGELARLEGYRLALDAGIAPPFSLRDRSSWGGGGADDQGAGGAGSSARLAGVDGAGASGQDASGRTGLGWDRRPRI